MRAGLLQSLKEKITTHNLARMNMLRHGVELRKTCPRLWTAV